MNLEERRNLERGIAQEEARQRVESWVRGLQEVAQAARDDLADQSKIEELKKTCARVVEFLSADINKRWADNLYLLKQELDRVRKEFGFTGT